MMNFRKLTLTSHKQCLYRTSYTGAVAKMQIKIKKGSITKTHLFKYIENFNTKNENFQMKNSGSFHISAINIDCGYSLEPPRRGGSNEYPQSMF